MNNWIYRRMLIGFLEVIDGALQSMRACIESGTNQQLDIVADHIYQVQLSTQKLQREVVKLPQS